MILESKLPFKYLIGIVKYELAIVLMVGIITHFSAIRLTEFLPVMPLAIPAFLGTSISVLLSFKMNQSYDRWWEARKIWGAIVNDSRSLVIQLQSFLSFEHTDIIKRISYRQIAWCYSLGRSLRGSPRPIDHLDHLITTTDDAQISKHNNCNLAMLQLTAADIRELRLNNAIDMHGQIHLQETIIRLTDSMGGAERISKTVFPSTYRLILHFIIYLFVITLAISLKGTNNVFVIPLLLLISAGFFCIEKIAFHLQDPFRNLPSDIPVTDIARTIEVNIRQLLSEEIIPAESKPNDYFVM
ncbi:bestrophin family protein [Longitalea luteola]|uniref:bestrophin family protein n=1 Tax=Longitalea luteola TaxID=2812563 RepID=UPI001A95CB62|nr:bestrophin family ion channel [Longitalea luteola]